MNNEEKILGMLETLTADVSGMKADISGVKAEMSAMKTDMTAEIAGVKTGMYSVTADTSKFVRYTISIDKEMDEMKVGMYGLKAEMLGLKTELTAEMSGLKTDVSGLKTEMSSLKTDVSSLKTDMSETKDSLSKVGKAVVVLEHDHKEMTEALFDGFKNCMEGLTSIKQEVERHDILLRRAN